MAQFYQIKVTLMHVEPIIWRRFVVQKSATFGDLHDAIQDACGWENSHLYSFFTTDKKKRKEICTAPEHREELDHMGEDAASGAHSVKLWATVGGNTLPMKFIYIYDFGDSWEHEVEIEKLIELDLEVKRDLLGGERAFPLEDMGSYPGYENACLALSGKMKDDPDEAESILEWIGKWKPDKFDFAKQKRKFLRA